MSLFGANTTFKKAVARMKAAEKAGSQSTDTTSSGIGAILEQQLDKITGPRSSEDGGVATTSEIAHELSQLDREDQLREFHGTAEFEELKQGEERDRYERGLHQARIEDELRRRENTQATSRVDTC
jgi:hypothetical protein